MPSVHGHARAEGELPHHEGWNKALDAALADASGLGRKGPQEVDVHFWLIIDVTNPGTIQGYGVTLNPKGGGH